MPANDWYEAHKPDVAAALKKGKSAPKDRAVPCTMVRMKDGSHLLCAAVSASKASIMVREARQAGGKVISSGQLFLDDGKVVFEVSEGALPAKAKFTDGAAAAGVPLGNAVFRPTPGAVLGGEEGAAPPPSPQPTTDGTAALKEALSRLVPSVQQAVKDHPERKNDLLQPIARCKQHIEKGQADEAKAALKEVIVLLKGLGPSANSPPPPLTPPRPPTPPPTVDGAPTTPPSGGEAFMARARVLKAAVDKVQATDPGRAADLSKLLLKAAASAKAKDFEGAMAALDSLEAALQTPSSTEAPESESEDGANAGREEPKGRTAPTEDEGAPPEKPQTAAERWDAPRAIAVAKLQDEIKLVAAADDPEAGKAELELRAVLKQLSGKMETRQQAAEMERYLLEDDVVAEVCELAYDLKTPLLKVLKEIRPQLLA